MTPRNIVMMIEFETDAEDEELDYTLADLVKRVPAASVANVSSGWEET